MTEQSKAEQQFQKWWLKIYAQRLPGVKHLAEQAWLAAWEQASVHTVRAAIDTLGEVLGGRHD